MSVDWMFVNLCDPSQRNHFYDRRHVVYGQVHDGTLRVDAYDRHIIDDGFTRLYNDRKVPDLCENYCSMAYAVASHLIVFGRCEDAEWVCDEMRRFLKEIAADPATYAKTRLIDSFTSSPTWFWEKYGYKALRVGAIAGQAIQLGRHNDVAIAGHFRCTDVLERHAVADLRDPDTGEYTKVHKNKRFRQYWLDALSDLIRCYFRVYALDGFSIETTIKDHGFRHYACLFRKAYQQYEHEYRAAALRVRWVDTYEKLALMCYEEADSIADGIHTLRWNEFARETEWASARETYYCAKHIGEGMQASAEIVQQIMHDIEVCQKAGFLHAADNLYRIRRAISRY